MQIHRRLSMLDEWAILKPRCGLETKCGSHVGYFEGDAERIALASATGHNAIQLLQWPLTSDNSDTTHRIELLMPAADLDDRIRGNDESTRSVVADDDTARPFIPRAPSMRHGHNAEALLQSTGSASPGSIRLSKRKSRPQLQSHPTTALSYAESLPPSRSVSRRPSTAQLSRFASGNESDRASSQTYSPNEAALDRISLLGHDSPATWQSLKLHAEVAPFSNDEPAPDDDDDILHEFDNFTDKDHQVVFHGWKNKLKHFFILSASGKPVYSRHGDDQIIGAHIGVIQTIVSSYQNSAEPIRGFQAGTSRFTILVKGPLTLVAISRLPESERQLQNQLESLYMQILSTLTLPSLEKMFSNRPSTDLRRPLQGTDVLLDGLADGFTRGSPSTLLSALECLRLRKTHRRLINDTFLASRSPNLVYGLIAAAGRLVSVVRPKKHSLHPGDLHLIFNMLFEAGSVKANGGENWIPLCLPGFNNTGYVYMYVSFLNTYEQPDQDASARRPSSADDDQLAVVLISASKDCFFELRDMRNELVIQLQKNGSMAIIRTAIARGQATCSDIVPGTVLRHFLYKSRGNVQFVMPSLKPDFDDLVTRRKLMSLYHELHEAVHAKTHLKIHYAVSQDACALAWETPVFELYSVAGPRASRAAMCQGVNQIIQWIRKEEERVFIIGGAVF
ncbi:hypothetical protein MRB53_040209 [Persea americana]|nr:hypothetical protein MRB53_040209 [Persea americana]